MTWLKVDDTFAHHPKVRAAGPAGRGLWLAAAVICAGRNTDGVVEALVVKDAAWLAEVDQEAAVAGLVASGLWHDPKTLRRCERCKAAAGKLPAGAFYFHDWLDYQLTRDEAKVPEHRARERRRKALQRNRELCEAIVDRDGHRCRYCAVRVNFLNKSGPTGGTYDHVDPDGPNTLENVVVACRKCNGLKRDRSPEEAGISLLPPPGPDLAGARPEPTHGQAEAEPGLALASASRARPDGPGRAGPRPGPGLAPAKSSNGSRP